MWRFYARLWTSLPEALAATTFWEKIGAGAATVGLLLNQSLGRMAWAGWEGFDPRWALVPLAVAPLYALLKANYAKQRWLEEERRRLIDRLRAERPDGARRQFEAAVERARKRALELGGNLYHVHESERALRRALLWRDATAEMIGDALGAPAADAFLAQVESEKLEPSELWSFYESHASYLTDLASGVKEEDVDMAFLAARYADVEARLRRRRSLEESGEELE